MQGLKRVARGESITADWANALVDEVRRLGQLRGVAPVVVEHAPAGSQVRLDAPLQTTSMFRLHSVKGTTVDDVDYWNARQVRVGDAGYIEAATHTHVVYDPLRVAAAPMHKWHPAFFNTATGRWELLAPLIGGLWAKALQDWQNVTHPYVMCHPCQDALGGGVNEDVTISVALPRRVGGGDPNIHQGDIVAYLPCGGELLCVSQYLDDKLRTIKAFAGAPIAIPKGWALADGVQNSALNGGSGADLSGRFIVAYKSGDVDYGTVGATGGSKQHQHSAAVAHNHTINLTATAVQPGGMNIATVAASNTGSGGGHQHDSADHRPPYFVLAFMERVL